MKYLVLAILAISVGSAAMATEKFAKRSPASVPQCEDAAMKAATFIDGIGWGSVKSEPLKKLSSNRDGVGNESFYIKSTVSGYVYHISIIQDHRSEACIVLDVKTSADNMMPGTGVGD